MNYYIGLVYLVITLFLYSCNENKGAKEVSMSDSQKLSWNELRSLKRDAFYGDVEAEKRVFLYYSVYLQDSELAAKWKNEVAERRR